MKTIMLLASEETCSTLQYALSKEYTILSCFDPLAGEAILLRNPDALLLSLFLPGTTGLIFLHQHAASLPPVVIVITSFIDNDLLTELSKLGVDSVFQIPYALPQLKQTLSKLLTKKTPPE